MQEISGAEAGERNVSVPAEIQLPARLPTCFAKKKDTASIKRKRECMEDKIHEMHLIVLTKESKKLDMKMENLLLERKAAAEN